MTDEASETETETENGDFPDFSGKIVLFYLRNTAPALDGGSLLEFCSFRRLGGRWFVLGRAPQIDEAGEWLSNLETAVAWDEVASYVVFRSREDYLDRSSPPRPTLKERIFGA